MLDIEKAYLAGIIDGEGSTMLTLFHKNVTPRNVRYSTHLLQKKQTFYEKLMSL